MKPLFSTVLVTIALLTLPLQSAKAATYYFHNDHLGTPQVVTDENQAVVWQGEYDPFGEVTESVNDITQNLRFPGQYYDGETGLHYNYFRDYAPLLGRYVESDPIGLDGGINMFAYVGSNPYRYIDPKGLSFEGASPPPGIPGGPWKWKPDADNPRGGAYQGANGAKANWDPSGHWDVNNGSERQRYDRWGNPTDRHRNPKRKRSDLPIKNHSGLLKKCLAWLAPGLVHSFTRNSHTESCENDTAGDIPFCN